MGTLGVQVGVLWALWGVDLDPSGHFSGKGVKKAPKMDAEMETFPMRFRGFVESGKQCLDCACAVGLGFGPLVFTLCASLGALHVFNDFLVEKTRSGERSASEAAPRIFDFKNKDLVNCTSNACFRSATGSSTCSLVGRPSTRGRIDRLPPLPPTSRDQICSIQPWLLEA